MKIKTWWFWDNSLKYATEQKRTEYMSLLPAHYLSSLSVSPVKRLTVASHICWVSLGPSLNNKGLEMVWPPDVCHAVPQMCVCSGAHEPEPKLLVKQRKMPQWQIRQKKNPFRSMTMEEHNAMADDILPQPQSWMISQLGEGPFQRKSLLITRDR